MCVLGAFMYSAAVALFVTPLKFAAGGVTGLGILVNYLFPFISTGMFVFAANIPLFLISWKKFGFRFISRTVFATALVSVFIDILDLLGEKYGWFFSGEEKLVGAIFGGIIAGAGLGIVFLGGATTGGLDIQLLGIGRNGPIAFNEPDTYLIAGTHKTALTEDTIEANSRLFNDISEVPHYALTMGMASIMSAKMIVLLANGKGKHDAILKLLDDKITPDCPASFLKLHSNVVIICDKDAYEG